TINDSQVLAATDFYCCLRQSLASFVHEVPGLHNHSLASRCSQLLPPADSLLVLRWIREIDDSEWRLEQKSRILMANLRERIHVTYVIFVDMLGAFTGKQVKGCKLQIGERMHGPAVTTESVYIQTRRFFLLTKTFGDRSDLGVARGRFENRHGRGQSGTGC